MSTAVYRVEVRPKHGAPDPKGAAALRDAHTLGIASVPKRIDVASVYLLSGDLTPQQVEQLADELLADPVTEDATIGAQPIKAGAMVEVHPLPGVMDPDAEAVQQAIHAITGAAVEVRTGKRYDMHGIDPAAARTIAEKSLANSVIHAIHEQPYQPTEFPHGHQHEVRIVTVPLRELSDEQLARLSREAHLFLSLEEMRAIQAEYRRLGRDPNEIELETIAQTWSEHCVHKTLKATIRYRENISDEQFPSLVNDASQRPYHQSNGDGSVTINNLLKATVAAATHELIAGGIDWCLSVFVDNSGVIAFDRENAVCFKVETHNHPSAIEPYGGAATGIGGCIRDVMGTGLAAKPIAATDVFCVATPDVERVPSGCLHPRRILTQVVAGVRDYGNRMGIPTLNGTVWFDDRYIGNPLVFCGCIGVMPRDKIKGKAQRGDRIVVIGGRTGRDGIHGATFSSAELTDTHADEFAHAVQIGNAITEKTALDAILKARDHEHGCLFNGITDCGAGGFSSAIGEMGGEIGAVVQLERAPLKYVGLTPTEIWISESQERMILAVPQEHWPTLRRICEDHDVEAADLGVFGDDSGDLILRFGDLEVGRLATDFLHNGLPRTTREAVWTQPTRSAGQTSKPAPPAIDDALLQLLAHPNIASKRWIIRQYDHEVQGRTVAKPLVSGSSHREGPGDAAVITPVLGSNRGLAIGNGLATGWQRDPYLMTLAAVDECVRNLVCVGADPDRIAILDNFCWPSCNKPENLGALVRAAEGCYDAAKSYRTPFISGKDSLNNQFTTEDGATIQIPYTLLISGMGIVNDVKRCITMDAKAAGNLLVIVGETDYRMGGSHFEKVFGEMYCDQLPQVHLEHGPRAARAVAQAVAHGLVRSAHDCSEGGLLVAAAEMAFAGGFGLHLNLAMLPTRGKLATQQECFAETPSRYLLEIERQQLTMLDRILKAQSVPYAVIGEFNNHEALTVADHCEIAIDDLHRAWSQTLAW